jgi:DNA-binding response OmpR family regulator
MDAPCSGGSEVKKILLVEDEQVLAKNMAFFLKKEGFEVDVEYDGETALDRFKAGLYDLVLLDWMLPKKDGLTVCRHIRQTSDVPLIMITAKGEVMDKVIGLEVGADDYIVKPFHQRELLARIHALLRRQEKHTDLPSHPRLIRYEELILDQDQMVIRSGEKTVPLTANEYKLLDVMMRQPERVFSRVSLYEQVWGTASGYSDRTVDVNISRLRKKITELTDKNYLFSVRGYGYRFGGKP